MPQRNVATNFTFEQQRAEINLLAQDFWTQKGTVDTASTTYLKHDGSNAFTGQTLAVPNAFTINANSGGGTVTIAGNLDVTGTTTTVSSANLEVTDKNILISKGSTTDAQADGAGITIDSDTDITWNFVDAKDAWVSSIGVESTTFLKATTFLEAARGQFTGATSPTTGSGVEVNAPDANTGQIIAYNRGTTTYNELRLRAASVPIYTGTTNALAGTFNSTGLTMESGKTITGNVTGDLTGSVLTAAQTNITSVGTLSSLGIGVAPSSGEGSELAVKGTDGGTNIALVPNADTESSQISFYNAAYDSTQGYIKYDNNTNSLSVRVNLVERLRIGNDGTVSKYHNATDIAAAFGGGGQVNGVTALPSMAGTPFVVAKDTGSGRSATFAGLVENQGAVTIRGYVGIGADSYTGYTFPTPTGIQNNVKLLQIDGGDGAELILGNSLSPNVSTNHVGAIAFKNIDNSNSVAPNYAGIRCNCTDTVGNMNLKFYGGATAFEADTPHMLIDALGKTLFNPHSSGETNNDTVVTIRGWAADDSTTVNEAFKNAPLKIRKTISATDLNGGVIDAWDDGVHAIGLGMNYGGNSGNQAGYHLVFGVNNDTNDRPTEKFRISGNGRAGLGVANPSVAGGYHGMEIGGHANSGLRLSVTSAGGWAFTDYNINGTAAYIVGCKGGSDALSPSNSWRICSGTSFDSNQLFVVNNNGSVLPGSDNTQDFGSSSFRWANVYTGDMHLNNMHSGGNEVDGTEGHWTMQEGSDDLFLINRNTGKKYKFNLTEV